MLKSFTEVFEVAKDEWEQCPLEVLNDICALINHDENYIYFVDRGEDVTGREFVCVDTDDPQSFTTTKQFKLIRPLIAFWTEGHNIGFDYDGNFMVMGSKHTEIVGCKKYMKLGVCNKLCEVFRMDDVIIHHNTNHCVSHLIFKNKLITQCKFEAKPYRDGYRVRLSNADLADHVNKLLDEHFPVRLR